MEPVYVSMVLDVGRAGVQGFGHVKQQETGSRMLRLYLRHDGAPVALEGTERAVLRAIRPDGVLLYEDCAIEGSTISRLLSPQIRATPGRVRCELAVYGADGNRMDGMSSVTITELAGGFEPYTAGEYPKVFRMGKFVHMYGKLSPTASIAGSITEYTMFTLPRAYWPVTDVYQVCHGSGISDALYAALGSGCSVHALDLGSDFVTHGSLKELYKLCGLDAASIAAYTEEVLRP